MVIAGMLERSPSEATGYWLSLVVAIGIATMGLVLDSAAVVIAAMLIAPLMTPIVALGMGLAVGSPFLVLRSAVRVALSVVATLGLSALITRFLPYHDLNAQIVARTSPTVLDLVTAVFCALAGVYATLRPSSDVASTAAGTSIGISLLPPLCASGFGVGTGDWGVAGGAALLFLTNMVAIIAVGSVAFAAAGFNQVDTRSIEAKEYSGLAPTTLAIARRLEQLFASTSGPYQRLLMPLVLLLALYFPLRTGLEQVTWQIRARAEVRSALQGLPFQIIESRVRVGPRSVELELMVLGSGADASRVESTLKDEIGRTTGVVPTLQVVAVPDAAAFRRLASAIEKPRVTLPAHAPVSDARRLVQDTLERQWPSRSAGSLQSASIATAGSPIEVLVVHVGAALEPAAIETLERSLSAAAKDPVKLVDLALPAGELTPADGEGAFIARVAALAEASRQAKSVWICVTAPGAGDAGPGPDAGLDPGELRRLLASHPRVVWTDGAGWRARATFDSCSAPGDAGAAETGAVGTDAAPEQ